MLVMMLDYKFALFKKAALYLVSIPLFLPPVPVLAQNVIKPKQLYDGIQSNEFDAIIDVRSLSEWNSGHIVNSTHIESLQTLKTIPEVLEGCEKSTKKIVVYCNSGNRAGVAIQFLQKEGINAKLFNGLGVSQWTAAGYELETTASKVPFCSDRCRDTKFSKVMNQAKKILLTCSSLTEIEPAWKRKKFCEKKVSRREEKKQVRFICPEACGDCVSTMISPGCRDRKNFKQRVKNLLKINCPKLNEMKKQQKMYYCKKIVAFNGTKQRVSDFCPEACGPKCHKP